MRAINVLLAILVSLIIGAAVLEGGLRLIGLGPQTTLNQFDPVLGWSKKPNFELSRKHPDAPYKIDFKLNSMGLRDDEISEKKPEDVFRVIALGDSFTLGFGVNREDLFVDVLEQWWNAEGRRVEIINAGTEGYSTDQQVAWLETVGKKLDPDLVLLFPYENDIYWNAQTEYLEASKPKPRYTVRGMLEQRTFPEPEPESCWEQWALTKNFVGGGPTRPTAKDLFKPVGARRQLLREWGAVMVDQPEFMNLPLELTQAALTGFNNACNSMNVMGVVVPIPSHSAIDSEFRTGFGERNLAGLPAEAWSPDKPVNDILDLSKRIGLRTIDCRTTFKGRTDAGESLYHNKDWHLNEPGNHALAQVLHDELDNLGALPDDRLPPVGAPIKPERAKTADSGGIGPPTIFLALWGVLTIMYLSTYKDEPRWQPPLKVGAMLTVIFCIILGVNKALEALPPVVGQIGIGSAAALLIGFIIYKLGRRVGTIIELFKAFTLRGHWYLMPLVVILLTIGSLLVVAASSPLIAPFIYTLF